MPSDVDVEALLSEALGYAPERRQAFVEKRCRHDPAVLGAVSALLRESDDSDPFLTPGGAMQGPLWEEMLGGLASSHDPGPAETPAAAWPNVPGYRIERVLGEGGMGVVYLAEQVGALRRQVALKVIKIGVISAEVLRRFELERHALALMEHPNIARVFEAGATSDGRPYVAMEYVRGESITSYLQQEPLRHPHAHRAVRERVRRRAARAPEGHHPS